MIGNPSSDSGRKPVQISAIGQLWSAGTISIARFSNQAIPPAVMTMGELKARGGSSSARQNSLPVRLSKATTHAPGFPPMTTISRPPSINGHGVRFGDSIKA